MALPILSHYDLHIKNFNSCELKFLRQYRINATIGIIQQVPSKNC